ncbi:hypothetical protein PTT_13568 [Pyrenophora teres f. teres 0-1]|uniref:Transposase Tc1-like domain-containing protein n=1 Tax=Pyrenophora teres f. teres (strain 0-1) TaxID=861557 RepID=E3RWC9_PYRTT|nr:hypothetical protein PTT_13568 [Pyrenophora teres f. teres 0-1]
MAERPKGELYREAGLADAQNNHATVSYRTTQRSLAKDDYRKYQAKRRPLLSAIVAKKRWIFARSWRHHCWDGDTVIKFSDECSIARIWPQRSMGMAPAVAKMGKGHDGSNIHCPATCADGVGRDLDGSGGRSWA